MRLICFGSYWPVASGGGESLYVGSQGQTGSLQRGACSAACDPNRMSIQHHCNNL
jgi:hypothetical protein